MNKFIHRHRLQRSHVAAVTRAFWTAAAGVAAEGGDSLTRAWFSQGLAVPCESGRQCLEYEQAVLLVLHAFGLCPDRLRCVSAVKSAVIPLNAASTG